MAAFKKLGSRGCSAATSHTLVVRPRVQNPRAPIQPSQLYQVQQQIRTAATTAAADTDLNDLEPLSSYAGATSPTSDETQEHIQAFDPPSHAKRRRRQLPPSRYHFRPAKYYRGPLHPHQPLPPADPGSREFIPGPFTLPRLQQTYASTFASDILTLAYQHFPPGYKAAPAAPRLRSWVGDSPYFKNRPLRAPRGADTLGLVRKPITFRNVPALEGITVHSFVKQASSEGLPYLRVASMAIQAITGSRCHIRYSKKAVPAWGYKADKLHAVTVEMKGEAMYHFLSKLVDVVLPRIRDWQGVRGSSGDDNGNITFGITPEILAFFPEIEINYDSYPPQMIPGCHITLKTTAKSDKDARLLLSAMGIPFYGKFIN